MTPLQALVLGRMQEKGWEPRDVEERGIPHATLHRYMKPLRMKSTPRQDTLRNLAHALDLPLEEVYAACVATVSFTEAASRGERPAPTGPRPNIVEAIENDPDLPAVAKAHLLNQYQLLRQLRVGLPPELLSEHDERRRDAVEQDAVDAALLAEARELRKQDQGRPEGATERRRGHLQ